MQTSNALIEKLDDEDELVQRVAVQDLVDLGIVSVEPLKRALSDKRARVRWGGAIALGRLGNGACEAVQNLVAALDDSIEYVRECAAEALAQIGEASVPALISALSCTRAHVQARAAIALGLIGPTASEAKYSLVPLLAHADDFVRLQSATALGKIGGLEESKCLEILNKCLDGQDFQSADAVVLTLIEMKAKSDAVLAAFVRAFIYGPDRLRARLRQGIRMIDRRSDFKVRGNTRSVCFSGEGAHLLAFGRRIN